MGDSPQFRSKDGCLYIYNQQEHQWYKFCPADSLPLDVKAQVKEIQEKAEALKSAT